ncbi:MAG: hypothetical protein MH472_08895 [Bacteroidia bacterium]|nr:hypothetical protein [Bacteroidia bacterium]
MKEFIHKVIRIGIFLAIIYLIFLCIWGLFLPTYINKNLKYKLGLSGYMNTRLKEADTISKVDILFLGSSHTYRGFDIRIFKKNGFDCFNLGSSNQTPIQTNLLVKRYLNQLKPKLVIYEVFPENFEMDGLESGIDIISNSNSLLFAFENAKMVNHITAYNTFLYSSIRKFLFKDLYFKESSKIVDDYYVNGGFVQTDKLSNQSDYNAPISKRNWNINKKQWDAFLETISLFKNENISFLLVQAPVCKSFYYSYENNNEIESKFKYVGQFYNFNNDHYLMLDEKYDFYDLHHLTQTGVKKFNNRLMEVIEELGILNLILNE